MVSKGPQRSPPNGPTHILEMASPGVDLFVPLLLCRDRVTGHAQMWMPKVPWYRPAYTPQPDESPPVPASLDPRMRAFSAWQTAWAAQLARLECIVQLALVRRLERMPYDVRVSWDALRQALRWFAFSCSSTSSTNATRKAAWHNRDSGRDASTADFLSLVESTLSGRYCYLERADHEDHAKAAPPACEFDSLLSEFSESPEETKETSDDLT